MSQPPSSRHQPKVAWGTALLVTAAFIGPGTVLMASRAGATARFELLWAVVFSVAATCILQIMAAKLGLTTGGGINAAIRQSIDNKWLRRATLGLILTAIIYGNSAYQTGNLLGAVAGITIIGGWEGAIAKSTLIAIAGGFALTFVWAGGLGILQKLLMVLVALMSLLFVAAAIGSQPDPVSLAKGLIPTMPESTNLLLVIGLIGTTVVPYNLFLHASAVAEQWEQEREGLSTDDLDAATQRALRRTTWDTIASVSLGGLITAAILIASASAMADSTSPLKSVPELAAQLQPAIGPWAQSAFAIGLLAAGLTSAITAPIAAGYCAAGCFGWTMSMTDIRVKLVATLVIIIGVVAGALLGGSPAQTIILAQVANGLVLPLIAGFLLFALNQKKLMGKFANGWVSNLLGGLVVLITALITYRTFLKAWTSFMALFDSPV